MEEIKFNIKHLVKETSGCNGHERYSHPAFTFKIPKDITPLDYSKDERLIEIELKTGEKYWVNISMFFGKVISEVKNIFLTTESGEIYDSLQIVSIEPFKIKRTMYWKLIFECLLPF